MKRSFLLIAAFLLICSAGIAVAQHGGNLSVSFEAPCSKVPKCKKVCDTFKRENKKFESCKRRKGPDACQAEQQGVQGLVAQLMSCTMQNHPEIYK